MRFGAAFIGPYHQHDNQPIVGPIVGPVIGQTEAGQSSAGLRVQSLSAGDGAPQRGPERSWLPFAREPDSAFAKLQRAIAAYAAMTRFR